ncbi:MAG: hypothetical protein NUV53_03200 [Patescibacteria group bacterium]|nr:hypothetical protein [Patescibacteria group bacterium]
MKINKIIVLVVGIVVVTVVASMALSPLQNMRENDAYVSPSTFPVATSSVVESIAVPLDTISDVSMHTSQEFFVVYDANGFLPKTITVKKGDTVVFQNRTGTRVSVASDDHPTHLRYPDFDQYRTDQKGLDVFRFVFTKVGTWGYHDHLNANMVGMVIVTE